MNKVSVQFYFSFSKVKQIVFEISLSFFYNKCRSFGENLVSGYKIYVTQGFSHRDKWADPIPFLSLYPWRAKFVLQFTFNKPPCGRRDRVTELTKFHTFYHYYYYYSTYNTTRVYRENWIYQNCYRTIYRFISDKRYIIKVAKVIFH